MLPLRFRERVVLISGGTDAIGQSIALRFVNEGARGLIAGAQAGDPPPTAAPFLFGTTSQPFDWSWGGQGVCYYCAHCAIINEQLPIDVYGHPMRVTEYPERPEDKCRWVIYKDPANIPGQAYTRVGRKAPGPA